MRRIGIFGGTFNPIHNGHMRLAGSYIDALELDRLLVIPDRTPPHKPDDGLISGAHRLTMCQLAFADHPRCVVSDIELKRAEKSFTVDTLEALHAGEYRADELYLIMGSDMFFTITEWRNWRRICELAVLCAGAREQDELERVLQYQAELERQGIRCRVVQTEPFVVSSTELRERLKHGECIREDIPAPVADYIEQHGLYRSE